MRTSKKPIAAAVLAAVATAVTIVPARADPIGRSGRPVTPKATDIVGVGSAATQGLFDQFSVDYNKTVKASAPHLYSWDAANPETGLVHDLIKAKVGCPKAPRPDGSVEGIVGSRGNRLGLTAGLRSKAGTFCTDFARSTFVRRRGRLLAFAPLAMDAVTYATNATTNAPADLTTAQLAEIYTCKVTNWARVGGKKARIDAQLPAASSETRELFLTAIGGRVPVNPGKCVNAHDRPGALPQENEGVSKYLHGPDVIFPYSVASYLAQVYHSAKCLTKSCIAIHGVTCKPRKGQNLFGCDIRGAMVLHIINKTRPTVPFPLPVVCAKACPILNSRFSPAFIRFLYAVVRWTAKKPGNIPGYLQLLFGLRGWACASRTAQRDIHSYGFDTLLIARSHDRQNPVPGSMTCGHSPR